MNKSMLKPAMFPIQQCQTVTHAKLNVRLLGYFSSQMLYALAGVWYVCGLKKTKQKQNK